MATRSHTAFFSALALSFFLRVVCSGPSLFNSSCLVRLLAAPARAALLAPARAARVGMFFFSYFSVVVLDWWIACRFLAAGWCVDPLSSPVIVARPCPVVATEATRSAVCSSGCSIYRGEIGQFDPCPRFSLCSFCCYVLLLLLLLCWSPCRRNLTFRSRFRTFSTPFRHVIFVTGWGWGGM